MATTAALGAAYSGLGPQDAWASDAAADEKAPASAREQAIEPLGTAEPWRFSFTPNLWIFALDGDIEQSGRTLEVSTSLHDTIDLLQEHRDFMFAGRLDAYRGDWSFFIDGGYVAFEDETGASRSFRQGVGSASAEVDWELNLGIVEFGAAYKIAEPSVGGRGAPVELVGGGRWNHLDYEADVELAAASAIRAFEREFSPSYSTDWVDPFIGARASVPFGDRVSLLLRGDVGGGFGNGSDFAWNVAAGFNVRVGACVDLYAGFKWYHIERDASGRDTDILLHGPAVGVTIRF
jgi:hypothetical protein